MSGLTDSDRTFFDGQFNRVHERIDALAVEVRDAGKESVGVKSRLDAHIAGPCAHALSAAEVVVKDHEKSRHRPISTVILVLTAIGTAIGAAVAAVAAFLKGQ